MKQLQAKAMVEVERSREIQGSEGKGEDKNKLKLSEMTRKNGKWRLWCGCVVPREEKFCR